MPVLSPVEGSVLTRPLAADPPAGPPGFTSPPTDPDAEHRLRGRVETE